MAKSFLSIGKPKLQFANHNLSNDYKYSCDFGTLIPVCVRECVPGDKLKYGVEAIVRLNPTVAPVLHKMDIRFEAFFVPNRLLWDKWEEFITNSDSSVFPPIMYDVLSHAYQYTFSKTLWDYLGLPLLDDATVEQTQFYNALTDAQKRDITPVQFPFLAYRKIWNDFYRDENIQDELSINSSSASDVEFLALQSRCWSKNDYFTSALPWVLRGSSPAINLDLSNLDLNVSLTNDPIYLKDANDRGYGEDLSFAGLYAARQGMPAFSPAGNTDSVISNSVTLQATGIDGGSNLWVKSQNDEYGRYYSNVKVNSATASSDTPLTINASDMRWLMQTQKFLERNARGGERYVEQVLSHFGVYTGDYRLQRPEFLGSTKSPIIVSEIPQTSASAGGSPQANLAGKGLGAVASNFVKYRVKEHGYFMVLASIVPKLSYASQGINKHWIKRSFYDYFFPEFSHLSEQPIKNQELFFQFGAYQANQDDFGFTGIYNEYRTMPDMVTGEMRNTFDYWHMARKFENLPALNNDFISIAAENNVTDSDGNEVGLKRIFAVPSEHGFLVDVFNKCHIVRPIPHLAEPGLVDHF